jgi:hypothetical protein
MDLLALTGEPPNATVMMRADRDLFLRMLRRSLEPA